MGQLFEIAARKLASFAVPFAPVLPDAMAQGDEQYIAPAF